MLALRIFVVTMVTECLVAMGDQVNNRPIIAVLAQDAPPYYNRSYIAASYVKYLESSGARVVPVPSHMTDDQVKEIFQGVNGMLLPGGGVSWGVSGYFKHAKYFFKKAMEAKENGGYFPIWGTCLGFQTLNIMAAGNRPSILTKFSSSDISYPLNYTSAAAGSRLFRNMSPELYKVLETESITYNHHNYGISPQTYANEPELKEFYNVLSYNTGKAGKRFISTIEAFDYPFYGTQWHPEKNNFEFTTEEHIPHSVHAVQASQYMANFFVNEARKSKHQFESVEKEQNFLIYNYQPEYTGKGDDSHFEQSYYFNDRN